MGDIGNKIRSLREAQGMTQEELAHKVGYKSRVSINKIELQRDLPIKKVVPIANALGVTPQEIMGWDIPDFATPELDADISNDSEFKELYKKFIMLTEEQKKAVSVMIDTLYNSIQT